MRLLVFPPIKSRAALSVPHITAPNTPRHAKTSRILVTISKTPGESTPTGEIRLTARFFPTNCPTSAER